MAFNLANVSMFFAAVPGPERWFANRATLLVTLIFAQIVVTLWLVGTFARKRNVEEPAPLSA